MLCASRCALGEQTTVLSTRQSKRTKKRREAITAFETLRAEQNAHGKTVASASGEEKAALVAQAKDLAERVKHAQAELNDAEAIAKETLGRIPNLVIEGVPSGGEENFVTVKTVGEAPTFSFTPRETTSPSPRTSALSTWNAGQKFLAPASTSSRGLEPSSKTLSCRGPLQTAVAEGFTPLIPPTLVRPEVMQGTGFLGEHADEVYFLPADDLYLTGTSEVALAGYHMTKSSTSVPVHLRYAALSTCYRREAGSHGKDVRGIIRVHQFQKLEMFSYAEPSQAEEEHQRLLAWQESMLADLGVHYRVIDVAAGDLGSSAARKIRHRSLDPSQQAYRELTSTSNCTTYQARRLNVRHRLDTGGPTETVATLNGTLATD